MTIRTRVTELLGIEHPVLLAPMGGVSGGALAAAVTGAGGLGIIGGGYGEADWLDREIAAAGNRPVGVGFITWSLAKQPALLDRALAHAPRTIFLSFGDIRPFAAKVKQAGAHLIAQVQTVTQAREAAAEGADIVVAQGTEAGGHAAARATLPLVPAVVDALPGIPVVAAGGIADGRGLAAALMLGAEAVLCGTAFVASEEALMHPAAKRALVAGTGDATQRSSLIDVARGIEWPEPWTIRTLENDLSRAWRDHPEAVLGDLGDLRRRYADAREAGDFSTAMVIAGEAADLVRAVEPAAAIVARMVAEAEGLLRRAPDRLAGRGDTRQPSAGGPASGS